MTIYKKDIEILKSELTKLPIHWDGKACVLELKEANYQWRQMEWWAFYFEWKVRTLLANKFSFPGDKFDNVTFDMKGVINWDLKAKAIKSDEHRIILNDKSAMKKSVAGEGFHGEIIALCDVEYNDHDRSFQRWHTELKGGKSNYELEREARTSISRYRKTKADLTEIVLLIFRKNDLDLLGTMKQGRNSNGDPRLQKYMLDLETVSNFENYIIKL
ncbi:MAG: hypothetical protein LBG17_07510 [Bacteroidales bacterium]|jgi:hypothetical protein|nr:hypothetical protein [Bacteroidales bacterium]